MKFPYKIIAFLFLLTNTIVYGQTPGFNYQALILNTSEIQIPGTDVAKNKVPLASEDVTFRFTITDDEGIEYIEEQSTTTDENGMISVIVGEGTPITSTFNKINWNGKLKYLNVEIDIFSNNEGFVFLDSQKILYLPHPANAMNNDMSIVIVDDTTNITPPFKKGDLIWVKAYGPKKIPTLIIWDEKNWLPVSMDNDPNDEFGLIVVSDNLSRELLFNKPVTGDQVWNKSCSCIEVYNGDNWASITPPITTSDPTIPYTFSNGLHEINNEVKLGGTLTEPTEFTTSSTNTLAIKNLEESNLADNEIVSIEKETGILRKSTMSSMIKQEEAVIFAEDGQLHFSTPIPISDPKKINVYRNGVRIDFIPVNTTTIELEQDAMCYKNDKIRIVQIH